MFSEENSNENLPEYIKITDVLDLHGFFPEQLPEIIEDFIQNAVDQELRVLRIIHGKGKSKLKWTVKKILKNHPQVNNFKDAPLELGGWGATVLELKTPTDN